MRARFGRRPTSAGGIRMMHTCTLRMYIALRAKALDGGSDDTRMDIQSSHLAQGTTLPPPRARVTATPEPILGEVFKFRVHCCGLFPTFFHAKNFDELEDERELEGRHA